jgi:hypothetical protein
VRNVLRIAFFTINQYCHARGTGATGRQCAASVRQHLTCMELSNALSGYLPESRIGICKAQHHGALISQLPRHLQRSHAELSVAARRPWCWLHPSIPSGRPLTKRYNL